jgi:class 3 adenylate cyclase/predicted ATPase
VRISAFLRDLGLEQYEPAFRENFIDEAVLSSITAEDLKEIGIAAVGHRRRILDAIDRLASAGPDAEVQETRTTALAERRQLTVVFCDLVGSTLLAERLDPEDLHDVLEAYHHTVERVVARSSGFVAKYMGDGVLIYFGYPQAHEDDAERAVLAALEVIDAVQRLDVATVRLEMRAGIATGLVVVGDHHGSGSAKEQQVVGETPNLAARLQGLASPNTVLIAASTRRLVGELFEVLDLGAIEIKGMTKPVAVAQVLRPSVVESRFVALRGSTRGRLVGRDRELARLLTCWERARAGVGQVVLLAGEAGIGKSRIIAALEERLRGEPHFRLRCYCSPNRQDSPLHPSIDELGRRAAFGPDDPPARRLEKLTALLAGSHPPEGDTEVIAGLMSLPTNAAPARTCLSPQLRKQRILEALLRHVEGQARQRPVVLVFEDVHWIDPTSRDLLDLAVERIARLPVLLIVTCRPEFHPHWLGRPQASCLVLDRLEPPDQLALIDQITGGRAIPAEVVQQILERADGIPFFIEELAKNVVESGLLRGEGNRPIFDGSVPDVAIPESLRDLLMARLDRSVTMRLVAQIGALIGRSFRYRLLRQVSSLSEVELRTGLARLVEADLAVEEGRPPDASYTFRHALIQDAAQGSLLRSTRQHLHGRIAEALVRESPELLESQPELFAHHYSEARMIEQSIEFWGKAGRRAASQSSMAEAARQFERGLGQLALLPETRENLLLKLEFLGELAAVRHALKGYAAPETGEAYVEAGALWERLDYPLNFFHVPFGRSRYLVHRGELGQAKRLDQELLRRSRPRNDTVGVVLSNFSAGRTAMFMGEFDSARTHLQNAITLYDPVDHDFLIRMAGLHHRTNSQGFLAIAQFCLGQPDHAVTTSEAAVAEAGTVSNAFTHVVSLLLAATLAALEGEHERMAGHADCLIAQATMHGFPPYVSQGSIFRGWGMVAAGAAAEGIALIRSGLEGYRATGAATWISYYTMLLARAHAIAGRHDEAAALLDNALQIVEAGDERWYAAELYRHRGEMLWRFGDAGQAEACFGTAGRIAGGQGARLFELRAATSLAGLQLEQGRPADARAVLAPVHDRFTEGFSGPDLSAAGRLLQQAG